MDLQVTCLQQACCAANAPSSSAANLCKTCPALYLLVTDQFSLVACIHDCKAHTHMTLVGRYFLEGHQVWPHVLVDVLPNVVASLSALLNTSQHTQWFCCCRLIWHPADIHCTCSLTMGNQAGERNSDC